jgi:hypothetical protein
MARPESKGISFIDALAPWILTPALIYVGVPVVFVSLITMLGLAMVHPLAAMIVPVGIGSTIGASYKRDAFPSALPLLSWNMRLLLLGWPRTGVDRSPHEPY